MQTQEKHSQAAVLGLQHLLAMYSGSILVPIMIATALGYSAEQLTYLISTDIFMCGVATFLQLQLNKYFGIGLPVVLGVAFQSVAPLIMIGQSHGSGAMFGALIVSGIYVVLISGIFSKVANLFPSIVTGSVITTIGLTLIPVALQTAAKESYPLDTFIDQVFQPLDGSAMKELSNHVQIKDGQLTYDSHFGVQKNKDGQVIIGHHKDIRPGDKLTLYFDKDHLLISKSKKELAAIRYQAINQEALKDKKSLSEAISKDWFQQNRLIISLFLLLVSGLLLTFNFFIVTFGASLFLYLTKKSKLFSFKKFKESYHFTLNCLGLPTLIAVFFGILGQPLTTMIMIQNILFVLFLVITFYRTHFRDEN